VGRVAYIKFIAQRDGSQPMIFVSNNSGNLVRVMSNDGRRVQFVKLHHNTREPIGSILWLGATKFALRYCPC
jgi:hypothetical protein